jgi:signal peptidase
MKKENKTLKVLKIVGQVVLSLVVVVVILFTATMLFTRDEYSVPNVFGYSYLSIATNSMEGDNPDSLFVGDLIVINRKVDKTNLKVGQIITFETFINGKRALNTHRIVSVTGSANNVKYETQGDNVNQPDLVLVSPSEVVGVFQKKMPGAGKFIDFLQSPTGFFVLIVLPALLFLSYELIQFIRSFLDYKLEKQGITAGANAAPQLSEEELKAKIRAELLAEMETNKAKEEKDK